MAFRFPAASRATALGVFFGVAWIGIVLGVALHFATAKTVTLPSMTRPYYGKKAARHVAPESLTGATALGADFAEVYVAALAARELRENGETQFHEFRPVAYPPMTLRIYGWLAGFPYSRALGIHSVVSLGTFLLAAGWGFHCAGIGRHWWKILLLTLTVLFGTPAGFSHFERGQFDLYTSAAIFLCLATVWLDRGRIPSAVAGGFFAALKLSSLPFLGTFTLAALASDVPRRRLLYLAAPAVVGLSLLAFAPDLARLTNAMQHMEWSAAGGETPIGERDAIRGVSFLLILPPLLAKMIPILSALVFMVAMRWPRSSDGDRQARFAAAAFPFALAMVIQGMAYGAGSWEYRVISLLGAAAAFVLWVEKVPGLERIQTIVGLGFAIFLLASTRTFHFLVYPKASWQAAGMSSFYLIFSVLFLGVAVGLCLRKNRPAEEKAGQA